MLRCTGELVLAVVRFVLYLFVFERSIVNLWVWVERSTPTLLGASICTWIDWSIFIHEAVDKGVFLLGLGLNFLMVLGCCVMNLGGSMRLMEGRDGWCGVNGVGGMSIYDLGGDWCWFWHQLSINIWKIVTMNCSK